MPSGVVRLAIGATQAKKPGKKNAMGQLSSRIQNYKSAPSQYPCKSKKK